MISIDFHLSTLVRPQFGPIQYLNIHLPSFCGIKFDPVNSSHPFWKLKFSFPEISGLIYLKLSRKFSIEKLQTRKFPNRDLPVL